MQFLTLVASGLSLAGCSPVDLLNWTIPRSGYTLEKDIAYGEHARQKLDIYKPEPSAEEAKTPRKVVVFFYGGSWQSGDRDMYRFVGQAFASKGFTTVIGDYRLYPEVRFPAFIDDGAKLLAWVHEHIATHGGDPEEIYLVGHSAGAYNAAMLALNPAFLKQVTAPPKIRAVVGIAGPYDFLPFTDPDIKAIFSTATDEATQPITYARGDAPPMLLLAGADDDEVYPKNTINLAKALRDRGGHVESKIYPDIGHIGIVLSLARGFRGKAPVLNDATEFMHSAGKGHRPAE